MEEDIGQYPVEELIAKARAAMDGLVPEVARAFATRALEVDGQVADAHEILGQIAMEEGDDATAEQHFLRAIELSPESGYSKYMYLGQLKTEMAAIECFGKGVMLMQVELEALEESSPLRPLLARQISSALVAMTEIYLTDCCFEEDAETKCEVYLAQALAVDPTNSEIHQTLASVRLSQSRPEEAKDLLLHSLTLWSPTDTSDDAILPSIPSRLTLIRLLIELDLDEHAEEVFVSIQREDDELVDLWYLWGFAYFRQAERAESEEERNEALRDAQECLQNTLRLYEMKECEDVGILEHTQEMLAGMQGVIPLDGDSGDEGGDAGPEGWETDEDAMEE